MNGSVENYLKHTALAAAFTVIFELFGHGVCGALFATGYFWAKEIGEKSKQWDAPRRPWSDINPLDKRWSMDDRFDLLSAFIGAWSVLPIVWAIN